MTDEGGYGRFGALSRVELERFFYLDDEDRRLIATATRLSASETVAHAGTFGQNTQLAGRKRFGRDDAGSGLIMSTE